MWILGVDLGQVADATAVAVVEQQGERPDATYALRHLERWLGVPYPEQVARVETLLGTPELADAALVIDRTGVGRAVYDGFALTRSLIGVTVHGGDAVTRDGPNYRVPKRDLVFAAVALLQQRRLRIAAALTEAPALVKELQNYRLKIDARTAHDSYSAWREGAHDDLVFALALALWAGEAGVAGPAHVWVLG